VIELKNDRVACAAVDARSSGEDLQYEPVSALAARVAGAVDLLKVELPTLAEVGLEALPAPPLVAIPMTVE
jgi:hypothetical protein